MRQTRSWRRRSQRHPDGTVEHIKVHEIDKAKTVKVLILHGHGYLHALAVAVRGVGLPDARHGEDISDLADTDHVVALTPSKRGKLRQLSFFRLFYLF